MADSSVPNVAVESEQSVVLNPASPPAAEISRLFYLILGIATCIFLIVFVPLLWLIFRFRAPRDHDGTEPPQIYGSNPIEIAWTVGPAIVVFVLFLVTARSVFQIKEPATGQSQDLNVRVIGHQWWWEFEYPEYGFTTANELHVPYTPAHTPSRADDLAPHVHLDLGSADVLHSFWVPQLSGKTDLVPGRLNTLWFEPKRSGWFYGQCAEYCGTQHAHMLLRVKAQTEDDFKKWVADQQRPAQDPSEDDTEALAGKAIFLTNACANCHTIRGTHAKGIFGPDLTHLMSRTWIAAGIRVNNKENLLAWVADPQKIKEGCRMPDMKLTEDEVKKVVAYLMILQ
ncbi:MAG: cytochrome c oxidase subunit II [Planctomycetales bacterium]